MMDASNQGVASSNTTTGGTMARTFALMRLQRQQQNQAIQKPGRVTPPPTPRLYVRKGTPA